MRNFKIKNIIIRTTKVIKPRKRNAQPKTLTDFQTWIPGIHFAENMLTVEKGKLSIGKQKSKFLKVEDAIPESLKGNTFTVDIGNTLGPGTEATLYLSGSLNDFILEFQGKIIEFKDLPIGGQLELPLGA